MKRSPVPLDRARVFSRRHRLFRPGDRVLVGVGGGGASLGLLGFLVSAQESLGIRELACAAVEANTDEGSDAAEAVADVGRVVRQLGLTFYGVRPAGVPGAGVDVVRELVTLARAESYDRVALGETRDDDAVRVLVQIAAGRGIEGVSGLAPRRRDGVVRPLLCLGESEACSLARVVVPLLPPDHPGTGRSLAVALRATVLPRMRALVPGLDEALAAVGRDARAARRIARAEAQRRLEAARRDDGSLELGVVTEGGLLARSVAEIALRAVCTVPVGRREVLCLSRLLARRGADPGSTLLSGAVATYVPGRRAVTLRGVAVSRPARDRARPGPGG